MFGSLGVPELIFIFALALLIFGPRKLPEIGRTIGRGLSEFRKASTDLKRSINAEMIEEEMRQSDPRKILREPLSSTSESGRDVGGKAPADPAGGEPPADPAGGKAPADPAGDEPPEGAGDSGGGAAPEGSVPRSPGGDTPVGGSPAGDAPAGAGAGGKSPDSEAP